MRIAVVGGGPAGLMSAFFCCNFQNKVVLFEKNEKVGKKLYITGKGRCNVTNEKCVGSEFLNNIVTNPKFLYSAISAFDYYDTVDFFSNHNCPLKVERGGRVFPESDKASDITKALTKACQNAGVQILCGVNIESIIKVDDKFVLSHGGQKQEFDKVILATGGLSYPTTGSTGDGYRFAKSLGHAIIKTRPSLIEIPLLWDCKVLEGLSLKNVELKYICENKKDNKSYFGEALFTDKSLSGPIALSMSAHIVHQNGGKLFLDFKPYNTAEELDKRLLGAFDEHKNADIQTIIKEFLPMRLVSVVLEKSDIDVGIKVNSLTKEQRQKLVDVIKNFELPYRPSNDFNRAVVTTGGVNVLEINAKTMESKICPGLYFAGEVIDVDAFTGGFNIQIALSTGYLAGMNAGGGK